MIGRAAPAVPAEVALTATEVDVLNRALPGKARASLQRADVPGL